MNIKEKPVSEHTNHMPGVRESHGVPRIKTVPLSEMDLRKKPGTELKETKTDKKP
jgi:hypothetical protein